MSPTYDVIVIGLGGMGSAAAHHLSRGAPVCWAWRSSARCTTGAPATAVPGSPGSRTSRIRRTYPSSCAPTSCTRTWSGPPAGTSPCCAAG